MGGGILGTLLVGALARPIYVQALTATECAGFVYTGHHSGIQLGLQILGLSVSIVWSALWAYPLFKILSRLNALRVDQVTELAGIDNIEHGGPAYPEFINYGASVTGGRER
uniref:Ammonium transporter AmtB-like domain-containing protein n=1 Tax=Chlamydomonas leiostraca TaxID=1034604 RepID=A0A7S0RXY3_9CHLO